MSEKRIYVYKMTCDNNGAPCVFNNKLSLAICKPAIRRTAKEGDILIGIGASNYDHKIIYVAEVSETTEEYFKNEKYRNRPDCEYYFQDSQYFHDETKVHHDPTHLEHDLGKQEEGYPNNHVLLSHNFVYLGAKAKNTTTLDQRFPLVEGLIKDMGRSHRVNYSDELYQELDSFKEYILQNFDKNTRTEPHETDLSKRCSLKDEGIEIFEPKRCKNAG